MYSRLYLAHHGILGMKWGVRRFQNKDGSLTAAGKKRYLQGDGSLSDKGKKALTDKDGRLNDAGLAYYNSQGYGLVRKGTEGQNIYERVSGPGYFAPTETAVGKDIDAAADRLRRKSEQLFSVYDEQVKNVNAAVDEVIASKDVQAQAQKDMADVVKDIFGDQKPSADDEELAAWIVATNLINERAADTPSGKKAAAYQAELDSWWTGAKNETEQIVSAKGNVVIGNDKWNKQEYTYKDLVFASLLSEGTASSVSLDFLYTLSDGIWDEWSREVDGYHVFADQILADYRRNSH